MKNIPFTSARICSRIWDYIKTIKVDGKQRSGFWKGADIISHFLSIKVEFRIFRKVSMVRWLKPPISWFKLNTDGAARGNPGHAAAGGIVRDHLGNPVFYFREFIGFHTNTFAELFGILRGFQLCLDKGLNNIWVEVDSAIAIKLIHNKSTTQCESLFGKNKPAISDAVIALSNHRSTETSEDSSKKISTGTRSGVSSTPVVVVDLGCFLFLRRYTMFPATNQVEGSRLWEDLLWKAPFLRRVAETPPKTSGSKPSLEAFAASNGLSAQTGSDPVDLNLLKGSASSENPVDPTPVANTGFLEGSSPPLGVPSGSVKQVGAADLRMAVSPEVWARFPEAVWNDAALIASEILKLPPPAGSASSPFLTVGQDGGVVVLPVPPVVKPVTPSDSSANGPDPEAPSFAALVTKKNVGVERIGSTDFSGPLPTAVFTKEECENVSAVYKNALIGKFSFGKPDNFAIVNCLFNNGFGKWFPMRLFKWDPFLDFKQEPALVPIWVKIMALPLQWFDLGALQTIGSLIGTFLKADPMTINRSRLDYARICVEVNLKNTPPKSVGISYGTIFKEFEVDYEKLPSFCHHCQHIGHSIDACYIKNLSLKPQAFTNKFLNMDNLQPKERDRSVWYTVGKGQKVAATSVSGVKNGEVGMPPSNTNVFVKNASALSDNGILVANNGFAGMKSLDEEVLCPPPAGYNVVSEEISSQGHVLDELASPKSQNAHKNKGSVNPEPEKGSSDPETHRGSHQDSLNNPNDLVLSSSEDDTEQTDDKAHQDGAMSDPSFNASSNFSGAEGDPPDSGQSPHSHAIVFALPKRSESSSIAGPAGKKGKSKKISEQETTSKNNNNNRSLFGFDRVISNMNNHIWIFSDVGIDVSVLFYSDQFLHTKVKCNDLPDHYLLSVVYGKNNKIERRIIWNNLFSVSQNITPWMVGGDFNIVLYPHEKKGDNPPILSEMEEDAILECNLMDGGYVGSPFTWYSNFIWQMLDRVFSRPNGLINFRVVVSSTSLGIPRIITPCYARLDSWSIPSPFSGLLKLSKKLARLKLTLREWNKVTFGNIFQNVEQAQKGVAEAEERFDSDPNMSNMIHLKKPNAELTLVLAMEDTSRVFMKMSRPILITLIMTCFRILFWIAIIFIYVVILLYKKLKISCLAWREIVLRGGFNASFYKNCWDIIKLDVLEAVLDFFDGVNLSQAYCSTYLTLIPKIASPNNCKDFRPISLCNTAYKIISKILSKRLSSIIPRFINLAQSGFIKDRLITDNILTASEVIHDISRSVDNM
ncbi:hypothetical protein OROMI_007812 [Orobanche minor]